MPALRAVQATDIAMLSDMARYMRNDYTSLPAGYNAASFPHANMPSLFWWDWNANSGDTGGLVQNDWLTVSAAPSQCPDVSSNASHEVSRLPQPVYCYLCVRSWAFTYQTHSPKHVNLVLCKHRSFNSGGRDVS